MSTQPLTLVALSTWLALAAACRPSQTVCPSLVQPPPQLIQPPKPMPCLLVPETDEPNIASVYDHSAEVVAMPKVTFDRYEALVLALRQRAQALARCLASVGGDAEDYEP